VYLVARHRDYESFFADRERFLRSWGGIARWRDRRNFEGLGFDMVLFIMEDGVDGELALSHEQNFRQTHGGPHVVLVDKIGLLRGVDFPKVEFGPPDKGEVEKSLLDFWIEARSAIKAWSRGKWWEAAEWVAAMRKRCRGYARLIQADDREERLAASFTSLGRDEVAGAIKAAVAAYLRWGPLAAEKIGAAYPTVLAQLGVQRVEGALAAKENFPGPEHPSPRSS